MSERKHESKGKETKAAIQPKREEEQQPDKKPSEALSRLSANVAQPRDIQALQKSVGNRAVQRLIQTSGDVVQRSFTDDPEYRTWRDQMRTHLRPMTGSLEEVETHHASEGTSFENATVSHNAALSTWNQAIATSGGESGGESGAGAETHAGGTASEEGETSTAES